VSIRGKTLVVAACLGLGAAGPARAQVPRTAPGEALALIVKVVATFASGDVQPGSGIVVGASADSLYIATACHVVATPRDTATEVRVSFAGDSLNPLRATLRNRAERCPSPASLDLAVLALPRAAARRVDVRLLAFDRRGEARALRLGDPVRAIGCPLEECWGLPGSPDDFVRLDSLEIVFQSDVVQPGSSGGGLFNAWWEVIGMVTEDVPPRAKAIRIDRVAAQLDAWRVPVSLRRPAIPRAGYRTTFGATLFARTPSPFSRVPAGRLTLSVRGLGSRVVWHAGLSRFAPSNLGINAGMAGVGLLWRPRERVTVYPFVEAGYASVEGRFDDGGYFVATGTGSRYVPLWKRVRGNGSGTGAGVGVQLALFPSIIGEIVAGYWSFTTPQPLPSYGKFQLGFGVRRGR